MSSSDDEYHSSTATGYSDECIKTFKRNQNKAKTLMTESNMKMKRLVQKTIEDQEKRVQEMLDDYVEKMDMLSILIDSTYINTEKMVKNKLSELKSKASNLIHTNIELRVADDLKNYHNETEKQVAKFRENLKRDIDMQTKISDDRRKVFDNNLSRLYKAERAVVTSNIHAASNIRQQLLKKDNPIARVEEITANIVLNKTKKVHEEVLKNSIMLSKVLDQVSTVLNLEINKINSKAVVSDAEVNLKLNLIGIGKDVHGLMNYLDLDCEYDDECQLN